MLEKLYYYEFRYYAKIMIPALIALLVATVVVIVVSWLAMFNGDIFSIVEVFVLVQYLFIMLAMSVLPMVIITMRFYKQFFTLQGYMTFTLPIKPIDHFLCKLTMALLASVIMLIFSYLSSLLIVFSTGNGILLLQAAVEFVNRLLSPMQLLLVLSLFLLQSIFLILTLYTSICIGQLSTKKILASIGAWIALNYGTQIINIIILTPITFVFILFNNRSQGIENFDLNIDFIIAIYGFMCIIYIAECIVEVFVCKHLITKKLNLE